MTPKEKAEELWRKECYIFEHSLPEEYSCNKNFITKQCALMTVDEMLEEISRWSGGEFQEWEKERWKYLKEVKQEIEKL